MATKNILETKCWTISGKHTVGKLEKKEVKLIIAKAKPDATEEELEKKTVPIKGDAFSHEHKSAKVADDAPSTRLVGYAEFARYIGAAKRRSLPDDCFVWPAEYKIVAKDDKGKEAAGFEWSAKQGAKELGPPPADAKGESVAMLLPNKDALKTKAKTPWAIVKDEPTDGKIRVRKLTVQRMIVPEFVKPLPKPKGAPFRQQVNLVTADSGRDCKGHEVEIEARVKDEGKGHGKAGDVIYVEVRFSRESKRSTPEPVLKDAQSIVKKDGGKVYTGELKLSADNATVKFKVEVGIAGGDTCEVRLSGVKDVFDGNCPVLRLVNWRRFRLEMFQPKPDVVSSFSVFRNDKKIGMSSNQRNLLKGELDKVFVEFDHTHAKSGFYDGTTDIGNTGAWRIYDGTYFGKAAGKKVFVTTISALNTIRLAKGPAESAQPKDTLIVAWADFLMERKGTSDTAPQGAAPDAISKAMAGDSATYDDVYYLFKDDPTQSSQVASVTRVRWKASHYDNAGTWAPIAAAGDPGGAKRTWQNVGASDYSKYVEFTSAHRLTFRVPARPTVAADPGTWRTTIPEAIAITVEVTLRRYWLEANAAGWHGYILMSTEGGLATDQGIVGTLLHEMGHNMAQAYSGKAVGPTYGLPASKKIPGIEFPAGVPGGWAYEGLGHTGLHCAFGISNADRQTAVTNGTITGKGGSASCTMYGEGDMKGATMNGFCEKCAPYVKAIDGSDIRAHWNEA